MEGLGRHLPEHKNGVSCSNMADCEGCETIVDCSLQASEMTVVVVIIPLEVKCCKKKRRESATECHEENRVAVLDAGTERQ